MDFFTDRNNVLLLKTVIVVIIQLIHRKEKMQFELLKLLGQALYFDGCVVDLSP